MTTRAQTARRNVIPSHPAEGVLDGTFPILAVHASAEDVGGVAADPPDGGGGESAPITAAHATVGG
jgi:hypothetical protein